MKEYVRNAEFSHTSEEPWPATETRWPIATWMSPWAFDDAGAEATESAGDADEPALRH